METPETRSSLILFSAALEAGQRGMFADSDKLFDKARGLREKATGSKGIDYANMLLRFADMCADNGRIDKAEALYKEALSIFFHSHGSEHMSTALLMRNLSEICSHQGKESDARHLKERANKILSRLQGS